MQKIHAGFMQKSNIQQTMTICGMISVKPETGKWSPLRAQSKNSQCHIVPRFIPDLSDITRYWHTIA
jgi:hypothetical protein